GPALAEWAVRRPSGFIRAVYAPLPCLSARAQYASNQTRCEMTSDRPPTPIFRHPTGSLLMISIDGDWRAAAAAVLLATGGSAMAGSLGGPVGPQTQNTPPPPRPPTPPPPPPPP